MHWRVLNKHRPVMVASNLDSDFIEFAANVSQILYTDFCLG
nr:hypothetical protein [Corynebacterium riegelii]